MNKTVIILILLSSLAFGQSKTLDLDKLDDAVVVVMAYDQFGEPFQYGSGFLIDEQGTVVTNYHVLKDAYSVKIKTEEGSIYDMERIIAGSEQIDLAKFKVKKKFADQVFPFSKLSQQIPKKGIDIWAIGAPLDPSLMNTASKGIVSNIYNSGYGAWTGKVLQISAEIYHGSSGGALFNNKGEIIGVTSGGREDAAKKSLHINFAVWIGELNNLPVLDLPRIFDESKIRVEVAFYLNYLTTGNDIYLFVDGIYAGKFDSYFTELPNCGQNGTISGYMTLGEHYYVAKDYKSGRIWSSTINILNEKCRLIGLDNRPKEVQKEYKDEPHVILRGGETNYEPSVQLKNRTPRVLYNTMFSLGTNSLWEFDAKTITASAEFYFKENKISIRPNYQYANQYQNFSKDRAYSLNYNYVGADLKGIWTDNSFPLCFYGAVGLGAASIVKDFSKPEFVQNGVYLTTPNYNKEKTKTIGILPSAKIGIELYFTSKICLSADAGVVYNSGTKKVDAILGLLLGYRFDLKK